MKSKSDLVIETSKKYMYIKFIVEILYLANIGSPKTLPNLSLCNPSAEKVTLHPKHKVGYPINGTFPKGWQEALKSR